MAEPTSILTFETLILELARKMGVAFYGTAGDEAAQIPTDIHDLAEIKRMVNNAIRMFINDAPTTGWRWAKPIGSFALWATESADSGNIVTFAGYDPASNKTTLTITSAAFLDTMEEKTLTLTTTGDQTITDVVSSTSVKVSGELTSSIDGETFSITPDGNYTLPVTFSGTVSGAIEFAANSNLGVGLDWNSESVIRQFRSDTAQSGDPYVAAVRIKSSVVGIRRRWELMVYPTPSAAVTVEFPFELGFDQLIEFTEVSPAPFSQDENLKAAVLAIGDKEGEGILGSDWDYYRNTALAKAYRIDARSAPRFIGSFSEPGGGSNAEAIRVFRSRLYQRPNVSFNS